MTSTLEYLASEILELAGNCSRDEKRKRIRPRDIMLAVENDEELKSLWSSTILPCTGTSPSIPKFILDQHKEKKPTRRKQKKAKESK